MTSLSIAPGVLAVELVPEGAPRVLTLPMESAPALADQIANNLARLLPGVDGLGLAVGAALFDAAQVLRPGFPIHAELARMHQQAQRGGFVPSIASFGAAAGRMAQPVLEPDPRLIGSPLLLIPWTLLGPRSDLDPVSHLMEDAFEDTGLVEAATGLFLQEAFSIRVAHARLMSQRDLCALMALHYEFAGFSPLWQLIECALLSPERSERVAFDDMELEYGHGVVRRFGPFSGAARQAEAILGAHGLTLVDGRG